MANLTANSPTAAPRRTGRADRDRDCRDERERERDGAGAATVTVAERAARRGFCAVRTRSSRRRRAALAARIVAIA